MKRLWIISILFFLLLSLFLSYSFAGTIVIGKVTGLYFDSFNLQYAPTDLKVYIDDAGLFYLNIPKMNYASFFFDQKEFNDLENLIKKALETGEKALKNDIGIYKEIGTITKNVSDEKGEFTIHTTVILNSSAPPKSRKQELIIDIKGFKNRYARSRIYIDLLDSNKLIEIMEKAKQEAAKYLQKESSL